VPIANMLSFKWFASRWSTVTVRYSAHRSTAAQQAVPEWDSRGKLDVLYDSAGPFPCQFMVPNHIWA
jgi:hypothetical protein